MDIALARTFLAVCDFGNFVKAAEHLYVTQSTVSARIKLLEDLLGQPTFVRTKAGAHLTQAGVRFKPFAERMVQAWEHARLEVGLPTDFAGVLAVGVEFTLWERLLIRWLPWMRQSVPDMAIRLDVGSSAYLGRQLVDGLLEIAVTYTPQFRKNMIVEKLMEEDLVLVSSDPATRGPWEEGYVYVDWGPEFRSEHMVAFPETESPVIAVSYGPLALQHIAEVGGAAYLPRRIVRHHLDDGTLHQVPGAPTFARPAYLVRTADDEDARINTAIQGLRYVATLETEDGQPSNTIENTDNNFQ